MKMNNIIVAIYIRVSTEEQAREGYSLAAQENVLLKFCNLKNYKIYKIYADEGISAKDTIHRPQFQEMIKDAKNGCFNVILVWKLTRLTRKLSNLTKICDELFNKNVFIVSYTEGFDCTTSAGRLMMNMLGTIAEFERDVISENICFALKERAGQGNPPATPVLGYIRVAKNKININPKEAQQIRYIYKKYLETQSLSEVSRLCERQGYVGKKGKSPAPQQIAIILTRPLYAGYILHKGKLYKGNHKSIISVDLFNKVQKIILKQGQKCGKQRKVILIKKL